MQQCARTDLATPAQVVMDVLPPTRFRSIAGADVGWCAYSGTRLTPYSPTPHLLRTLPSSKNTERAETVLIDTAQQATTRGTRACLPADISDLTSHGANRGARLARARKSARPSAGVCMFYKARLNGPQRRNVRWHSRACLRV